MSTKSCSRITWLTNDLANKLSYLSLQWLSPPKLNQTCFIYPRASPTMGGSVAVDFDMTQQFSSQCVGLLHVFLLVSWWAEKRILLGQRKLLKKSFVFLLFVSKMDHQFDFGLKLGMKQLGLCRLWMQSPQVIFQSSFEQARSKQVLSWWRCWLKL